MADELEMTWTEKQPAPPAKSYRRRSTQAPQTLKLHEGDRIRTTLRDRRNRWRIASKPIHKAWREASTNETATAFEALSQTNSVPTT